MKDLLKEIIIFFLFMAFVISAGMVVAFIGVYVFALVMYIAQVAGVLLGFIAGAALVIGTLLTSYYFLFVSAD